LSSAISIISLTSATSLTVMTSLACTRSMSSKSSKSKDVELPEDDVFKHDPVADEAEDRIPEGGGLVQLDEEV